MGQKTILRNFENFLGIHKGFSDLTRPQGYAGTAQNMLIDENFDVVKRPGCKTLSASNDNNDGRGIKNYTYLDKDTGATIQQLILYRPSYGSVGSSLTKLSKDNLEIGYPAGGTASTVTLTFKPNSSNVWELDIKEDGVSVDTNRTFPQTFGTAQDDISGGTAKDLEQIVDQINGLDVANGTGTYTCTWNASLIADTSIAAWSVPIQIDLDISSTSTTIEVYYEETVFIFYPTQFTSPTAYSPYAAGFVNPTMQTAQNLLYIAPNDYLLKYDGIRVFRAGLPLPPLETNTVVATTGSSTLTGDYIYAFAYAQKDNRGNIFEGPLSDDFEITFSGEDGDISVLSPELFDIIGKANGASSGTSLVLSKTDYKGKTQGLKVGETVRVLTSSGAESGVITAIQDAATTVTLELDTSLSAWASGARAYRVDTGGDQFLLGGGLATTTTTSNTIVCDGIANLQVTVGEKVYFYDEVDSAYVERTVTDSSALPAQIEVDGNPVTLGAGPSVVSTNGRIRIYRTKAGGVDKFLVEEIPWGFATVEVFTPTATRMITASLQTYVDSVPDDELGAKYILPVRDPDPPPKCRFIITHQGLSILSGDLDNPNTVYFSEPDNIEGFPLASNSFDIQFTTKGPITGLGIDNGALVVFKENSRAIVFGDLANNTFTVQIQEDGIGCPSHHSIQSLQVGLCWLSHQGPQRQSNGVIDPQFPTVLANEFKGQKYIQEDGTTISTSNESKLVAARATSVNDYVRKLWILFVPAEEGAVDATVNPLVSDGRHPNENSRWFVYDYENGSWFEWVFPEYINGYGGMEIFEEKLVWLSCFVPTGASAVKSATYTELTRGDQYDYADDVQPIEFKLSPTWEDVGAPSTNKKFLHQKTWSIDPSLNTTDFTLTVKSYRNFDSSSSHSSYTQTFTAGSTREVRSKLKSNKSRALQLEFSNNTLHTPVRLTGWEYEVVTPFNEEVDDG